MPFVFGVSSTAEGVLAYLVANSRRLALAECAVGRRKRLSLDLLSMNFSFRPVSC
jgi:hypothetical protein